MLGPEAQIIRHGWRPASLVLALALGGALRLAAVPGASVYHPDELFQYLEQAHRLVFGAGIVPWEYRDGIRSWILPLAVSLPMRLGAGLSPGSGLYLLLPRAAAALASLAVVASSWALGRRRSPRHALVAGVVAATWPEFVYMAPHVLSETASVALFLPAAVLVTGRRGDARMAAAGALLGLSVLLRVQHTPAAALLALWAMSRRQDCWIPFATGVAAAIAADMAVDLAMGQRPFAWALGYVSENLIAHKADQFGVSPPWAYLAVIAQAWGAWTGPVVVLAIVAARRAPVLFGVAALDLVTHMLVGHKEYRFILLATTLLPILAALGSVDVVERVRSGRERSLPTLLTAVALAGWLLAAGSIATARRPAIYASADHGGPALSARLRGDPGLCGLATIGLPFADSGGYAYLHRAVPVFLYLPADAAELRGEARGFNRLIAPRSAPLPAGFVATDCQAGTGGYCIAARPGGCAPIAPDHEINRWLRDRGL